MLKFNYAFGETNIVSRSPHCRLRGAVLQRRYDIIGLKDVFLDYAGRMTASCPVHQLLEQTMVGDLVQFKNAGERLEVCNLAGQPIAVLAKAAKEKWTDAQEQIESIKVLAIVERRTDDSKNPDYKNLLQVESWEVPVLEVVWSIPTEMNRNSPC